MRQCGVVVLRGAKWATEDPQWQRGLDGPIAFSVRLGSMRMSPEMLDPLASDPHVERVAEVRCGVAGHATTAAHAQVHEARAGLPIAPRKSLTASLRMQLRPGAVRGAIGGHLPATTARVREAAGGSAFPAARLLARAITTLLGVLGTGSIVTLARCSSC